MLRLAAATSRAVINKHNPTRSVAARLCRYLPVVLTFMGVRLRPSASGDSAAAALGSPAPAAAASAGLGIKKMLFLSAVDRLPRSQYSMTWGQGEEGHGRGGTGPGWGHGTYLPNFTVRRDPRMQLLRRAPPLPYPRQTAPPCVGFDCPQP